jgi:hypothetical protein
MLVLVEYQKSHIVMLFRIHYWLMQFKTGSSGTSFDCIWKSWERQGDLLDKTLSSQLLMLQAHISIRLETTTQ